MLDDIANDVSRNADIMRQRWKTMPVFADHISIFNHALDRYIEGDYISATALLYPRIEGVMRTHHQNVNPAQKPSADNLVTSAVNIASLVPRNMLLPERFDHYLREVYFKNFDPSNPTDLSRHTASHGVTPAHLFDRKGATLGFLIAEQMSYYLT
jgi:hypothetical protein